MVDTRRFKDNSALEINARAPMSILKTISDFRLFGTGNVSKLKTNEIITGYKLSLNNQKLVMV
jgi:hypothetical protein